MITQAITDTSETASRGNVQFPELIEFELCSQRAVPKATLLCTHLMEKKKDGALNELLNYWLEIH